MPFPKVGLSMSLPLAGGLSYNESSSEGAVRGDEKAA